jgi:PEP-CTERM motif-containing protein
MGNRDPDVEAYTMSEGPYGTYDQGGNVMECTEMLHPGYESVHRGASWSPPSIGLAASDRIGFVADYEWLNTGFRIASIAMTSLAADFDCDGDVDGDDFLWWQSSFGVDTGGDADNDGDTDGDDFLIWQSEFGSGVGSAGAEVPEPSSWLLVGLVVVGILSLPRRNR